MRFLHADDTPIRGVQLRLEDRRGGSYYRYPVLEYSPQGSPASDVSGLLVFHHIGAPVEYSEERFHSYGLLPIVRRKAPRFVCRFLQGKKDVYSIDFSELMKGWSRGLPTVTRKLEWPPTPPELRARAGESLSDAGRRALPFFDVNKDGVLDKEERVAADNLIWLLGEETAKSRMESAKEGIQFLVLKRVVKLAQE